MRQFRWSSEGLHGKLLTRIDDAPGAQSLDRNRTVKNRLERMKTRLVSLYFSCQWGIMGRLAFSVSVVRTVLSNGMFYEKVRFPIRYR